ncbi:hypothetical protein TWF506_008800 [Arthrobotrys conoides]|uniref:Uncharacterized protein n=1 Tax=Arthrobotrys conoides TaxID=74498 RepID=A0AAN8N6L7_9PEZI
MPSHNNATIFSKAIVDLIPSDLSKNQQFQRLQREYLARRPSPGLDPNVTASQRLDNVVAQYFKLLKIDIPRYMDEAIREELEVLDCKNQRTRKRCVNDKRWPNEVIAVTPGGGGGKYPSYRPKQTQYELPRIGSPNKALSQTVTKDINCQSRPHSLNIGDSFNPGVQLSIMMDYVLGDRVFIFYFFWVWIRSLLGFSNIAIPNAGISGLGLDDNSFIQMRDTIGLYEEKEPGIKLPKRSILTGEGSTFKTKLIVDTQQVSKQVGQEKRLNVVSPDRPFSKDTRVSEPRPSSEYTHQKDKSKTFSPTDAHTIRTNCTSEIETELYLKQFWEVLKHDHPDSEHQKPKAENIDFEVTEVPDTPLRAVTCTKTPFARPGLDEDINSGSLSLEGESSDGFMAKEALSSEHDTDASSLKAESEGSNNSSEGISNDNLDTLVSRDEEVPGVGMKITTNIRGNLWEQKEPLKNKIGNGLEHLLGECDSRRKIETWIRSATGPILSLNSPLSQKLIGQPSASPPLSPPPLRTLSVPLFSRQGSLFGRRGYPRLQYDTVIYSQECSIANRDLYPIEPGQASNHGSENKHHKSTLPCLLRTEAVRTEHIKPQFCNELHSSMSSATICHIPKILKGSHPPRVQEVFDTIDAKEDDLGSASEGAAPKTQSLSCTAPRVQSTNETNQLESSIDNRISPLKEKTDFIQALSLNSRRPVELRSEDQGLKDIQPGVQQTLKAQVYTAQKDLQGANKENKLPLRLDRSIAYTAHTIPLEEGCSQPNLAVPEKFVSKIPVPGQNRNVRARNDRIPIDEDNTVSTSTRTKRSHSIRHASSVVFQHQRPALTKMRSWSISDKAYSGSNSIIPGISNKIIPGISNKIIMLDSKAGSSQLRFQISRARKHCISFYEIYANLSSDLSSSDANGAKLEQLNRNPHLGDGILISETDIGDQLVTKHATKNDKERISPDAAKPGATLKSEPPAGPSKCLEKQETAPLSPNSFKKPIIKTPTFRQSKEVIPASSKRENKLKREKSQTFREHQKPSTSSNQGNDNRLKPKGHRRCSFCHEVNSRNGTSV